MSWYRNVKFDLSWVWCALNGGHKFLCHSYWSNSYYGPEYDEEWICSRCDMEAPSTSGVTYHWTKKEFLFREGCMPFWTVLDGLECMFNEWEWFLKIRSWKPWVSVKQFFYTASGAASSDRRRERLSRQYHSRLYNKWHNEITTKEPTSEIPF